MQVLLLKKNECEGIRLFGVGLLGFGGIEGVWGWASGVSAKLRVLLTLQR